MPGIGFLSISFSLPVSSLTGLTQSASDPHALRPNDAVVPAYFTRLESPAVQLERSVRSTRLLPIPSSSRPRCHPDSRKVPGLSPLAREEWHTLEGTWGSGQRGMRAAANQSALHGMYLQRVSFGTTRFRQQGDDIPLSLALQ